MSGGEWADGSDWAQAWKHLSHGVILAVALLGLLAGGTHLVRRVLLPAEETLRRGVYEESKSYRDGTVRDLDNLRLQWAQADDELHRAALREVALHRSADFPADALPDRLRAWLDSIR